MSEANVRIVRQALDEANAFMRGAITEEGLTALDPLVEHHWHGERTLPDMPQRLRGTAEMTALGVHAKRVG